MEDIAKIANQVVGQPFDPKIEATLEIAYALLEEQLNLDKEYEWGERAPRDDRFVTDSDDIPSADDLKNMWEEE